MLHLGQKRQRNLHSEGSRGVLPQSLRSDSHVMVPIVSQMGLREPLRANRNAFALAAAVVSIFSGTANIL